MMNTYAFRAVFLRSPESEGAGSEQKGVPKKPAVVSRLGRGLGALIPPANPRTPGSVVPSQAVTAEPKLPGSGGVTEVSLPGSTEAARALSRAEPALGSSVPSASGASSHEPKVPAESGSIVPRSSSLSGTSPQTGDSAATPTDQVTNDQRSTWNTHSDQAVVNIPIARIQRNPRQPRERFEDAALRALADSIRQDGLLQPVVVRASRTISGATGVQMYELIAGERRLRAFTLLGRSSIPALVQKVDDRTSAVLALIENIQREDLNPMERAHGLQKLMHEFAFTQQDLAARVGLDRSSVANLLRLNDLDPHTAGALREGSITTGHAKALLGISDVSIRKSLVTRIITEGLSVRELEREARQASAVGASASAGRLPSTGRVVSAQVADLERRIGAHLGTGVLLKTGRKAGSGSITISFGSHSQFEGLMDRIGFDLEASDRPRGR